MRPRGTVERTCVLCQWMTWHDPLSSDATAVPFVCSDCKVNPMVGFQCKSCNRDSKIPHRLLSACNQCCHCVYTGVPPGDMADIVYCWSSKHMDEDRPVATHTKEWRGDHGRYHLCDSCAGGWIWDRSDDEQKAALRRRGLKVDEHSDGSWSFWRPS